MLTWLIVAGPVTFIDLLLVPEDQQLLVPLYLHLFHQHLPFHHDQLVQLALEDLEYQDLLGFQRHQVHLQLLGYLVHRLVLVVQVVQIVLVVLLDQ